jgi:hypothetical protein
VALISAPIVSATTAATSQRLATKPTATTIAKATSRSLCPLATEWNSTIGFAPKAASAYAVRSGRSRLVTTTIATHVARLAAIAISRYASTWSTGFGRTSDSAVDSVVHAGP